MIATGCLVQCLPRIEPGLSGEPYRHADQSLLRNHLDRLLVVQIRGRMESTEIELVSRNRAFAREGAGTMQYPYGHRSLKVLNAEFDFDVSVRHY